MNCIFNTFLVIASTRQKKSKIPPLSPFKESLNALSKLIEDKFTSLEGRIDSLET